MTKREFLDTVFALAPNEANKIMDAFDEYVESDAVSTGRSGKERRMNKYIIEIPDDVQYVLFNGKADNKYYTAVRPIAELEELNIDYINKNFGSLQDRAMDKAWQLAEDVIYNRGNVLDILHCATVGAAFDKYSARQALDILEEYESRQKDRIEVGDEVEWDGDKYVVTYLNYNIETSEITDYDLLAYDGSVIDHVKKCTFTKTGKHYDIASILEAMRK